MVAAIAIVGLFVAGAAGQTPATPKATGQKATGQKSPAQPSTGQRSTGQRSTGQRAATTNPLLNPAALTAKAPEVFKANFDATAGPFVIEVHRDWDPTGADRFYNLVKNGFFNGARFFRVVPGFMVQFGINGDPAVNAKWSDASARIKDSPVKEGNVRGNVSFAKPGARDARTTQLFINFADNTGSLDPQGFSSFGKVISGMENVDKIFSGYGEQPRQDLIQSEGNAYLEKSFPKLDYIKNATIAVATTAAPRGTRGTAATAAKAPATKSPATKTPAAKAPAKTPVTK
jgi:peptidyl-prolyl cis-trans isomerase A (cyclophilin A)